MTHLQVIIEAAAEVCGIGAGDVIGSNQQRQACDARAIAVRLARIHTRASYPEIAHAFGRRHHSTMVAAHQRAQRLITDDEDFRRRYQAAEERVLREVVP